MTFLLTVFIVLFWSALYYDLIIDTINHYRKLNNKKEFKLE